MPAPAPAGAEAVHDGNRRRRRWPFRVAAVAVTAWLLWMGVELVRGVSAARAGREALTEARRQAAENPTAPEPIERLQRAAARLEDASGHFGSLPLWPVRLVPVVGRQIRSADAVTSGGAHAATVAADGLARIQERVRGEDRKGPERLRLLRDVAEIGAGLERQLGQVDLGPDEGLIGPLAHAHDRLADELGSVRAGLRRAVAGARAVADLLQGRRYLLLAANNAEMRSGSGMFLSAGVLETREGDLILTPLQPTFELPVPPGAVAMDADVQARWGWLRPNEEWRNLGVSPRFDVTGPQALAMWAAVRGETLDGVLAIDVGALRAVLAAVGPVDVEGNDIDADTVVERILHDQYVDYRDEALQAARREELGLIARAALTALQEREWDPAVLGRELAQAARQRHVLAWSRHPAEQQGWVAAGIDGAVDEDSLLVGVLNRGGNKLDRFLRVRADLDMQRSGRATTGVLRLTLKNEVPVGEPERVAGPDPHSGVGEGVYLGIVAVTLPGDARNGRVDGDDHLVAAGADGPTRVVATTVQVARGEERTVVVRFDLPPERQAIRVLPSARMPRMIWSANDKEWSDDSAHTIAW